MKKKDTPPPPKKKQKKTTHKNKQQNKTKTKHISKYKLKENKTNKFNKNLVGFDLTSTV